MRREGRPELKQCLLERSALDPPPLALDTMDGLLPPSERKAAPPYASEGRLLICVPASGLVADFMRPWITRTPISEIAVKAAPAG